MLQSYFSLNISQNAWRQQNKWYNLSPNYTTHDLRFGTDEIGTDKISTDEIWTIYLGGPNLNFMLFLSVPKLKLNIA